MPKLSSHSLYNKNSFWVKLSSPVPSTPSFLFPQQTNLPGGQGKESSFSLLLQLLLKCQNSKSPKDVLIDPIPRSAFPHSILAICPKRNNSGKQGVINHNQNTWWKSISPEGQAVSGSDCISPGANWGDCHFQVSKIQLGADSSFCFTSKGYQSSRWGK